MTCFVATVTKQQFITVFVIVTCNALCCCSALFFICLFAINSNQLSNWPWLIIEFVFNGSWGVIYFVAACVSAAYTYNLGQLIAATVFAFFTTIAYLLHGLLDFMEWRGTPIGNPRSDGVHVSA